MKTKPIIWGLFALFLIALLAGQFMPVNAPHADGYEEEGEALSSRIMGRFEQEFRMTVDPALGVVPRERLVKAQKVAEEKRSELATRAGVVPLYWDERGPNNVGGRTRSLLVDANDPTGRTVWSGSVSGGLWRTTDIDAANPVWIPVNDLFQNLAVSSIVQDPTDANSLFFGTGEGWGNADAVRGLGVWNSTDGGTTWTRMPPLIGGFSPNVNKLLFNGVGTLYAATSGGLFRYDPVNDAWGAILSNGLFANANFICDIELAANGDLYAATLADGVYRSTDDGDTWTAVMTGLPTSNFGRIELACAPSNAATVYAIFADTQTGSSGSCLSVHQTVDSGNNWTTATCPGNFGSQAWYDLILAVDPNDANRIWVGGVGISVSADGGANWTALSGIHVDHHAILYYPGDSDEILFGNDGGVYKSYDGSQPMPTFVDKNNSYNVTQFYAVGLHPDAGSNYMLAGTQDNATPKFTAPGVNATTCVLCCCDGGWAFVDEDDPSIQIASTQNGSFNLSTDGGNNFTNIIPGDNNRLFITPAEYDDAADILYISDTPGRLRRVVDVGGANTVSSDTLPALNGRTLTNLIKSPSVANRIYVGTTNGRLYQIDNAHQAAMTTVTDLNGPGGGWVSSIAVDENDESHLLVTFSNFGVVSVWETEDAGTNWQDVEGDLPDMPVRWVLFHPFDDSQAVIATEMGVWTTDELNGADTEWFPTNTYKLANVRVDMLQYRSSDHLVAAATHGRGMYTSDYFGLLETCVANQTINGNVAPGLYMAEDYIESGGTVSSGESVVYQAGDEIVLTPDFRAEKGSFFVAAIQACGSGGGGSRPGIANGEVPARRAEAALAQPRLNCYPNPTDYLMTVEVQCPSAQQWHQLYVKDLTGRTMARLAQNRQVADGEHLTYELNARDFPPGYYVLVLQTSSGAVTQQFVVAR